MICDRYKISKEDVDIYKEIYESEDIGELGTALIGLARERTRLHCLPARWECVINNDGTALVKRFRNSPKELL